MKSFGVRSRRCRDDQRASLKQRLFGYFSVCFLSSPPSADEDKSSSNGSSPKVHCTQRTERQARKKLSSSCSTSHSIKVDSSSAGTNTSGPSKKKRGGKVNIWKRRMDRCPVAASPLSPPATIPTKPFWKVFSKSDKSGQARQTGPAVNPGPQKASHGRVPSPCPSSTSVTATPARAQAPSPAFCGAKPVAHLDAQTTIEIGGSGGVLVQDSIHDGAKTGASSDSIPAVVRPDAVGKPASAGVQRLNDSRCSEPAQSQNNAAPPSIQVGTASEHQNSVRLVSDQAPASCVAKYKMVIESEHQSSARLLSDQETAFCRTTCKDTTSSSRPDTKHKPAPPTVEHSIAFLMWIGLLVALLLGWYGVHIIHTSLWGPADLVLRPTHAAAVEETVTVGLSQHLPTAADSWLTYIRTPKAAADSWLTYIRTPKVAADSWLTYIRTSKNAVVTCCWLLVSSKAGRVLFGVAASCFVAAAVVRHLAAALVSCISMLWAAVTAVGMLLKGCVAVLLAPRLVIIAVLLASTVLFCVVQAVKRSNKRTHRDAAAAPNKRCEAERGSHVSASSSASSTSSSGSSRESPGNASSSSTKTSCNFEEMASDSKQPVRRDRWSWRNMTCNHVLVETRNNKKLIKAVHVSPVNFGSGDWDQALQTGTTEKGELSNLPRMACSKGCVGLSNDNFNCYANAVLQCLTAIPEWSRYFLSGGAEQGPGRLHRPVSATLAALLRTMWLSRGPVNPMPLLRKLGKKNPCWGDGTQQDCHDFLVNLLEALEDEVNRVTGPKPYLESLSGQGSTEEQAEEAWQYCRSRCNSRIQELLTGQLQTRTTCSCCQHHSLHFDEFQTLSLKFPPGLSNQVGVTLQELLANYSCPTKAEFKCGLCGTKGDASQQQSVCRWPKILVLQLARFSTDEAVPVEQQFSSYEKVQVPVNVPGTLVPLELTCKQPSHFNVPTFELSGEVDHEGGLHGGHYTAACRSAIDGSWQFCNDTKVYRTVFDGAMSEMPYLLFYRRKD